MERYGGRREGREESGEIGREERREERGKRGEWRDREGGEREGRRGRGRTVPVTNGCRGNTWLS